MESAETSGHPHAEVSEFIRILAAHNVQHLLGQLEGRRLELEALARRVRQQEAEVDVEHVALNVNQDVLIMSVLYLKDIANQAVCTQ